MTPCLFDLFHTLANVEHEGQRHENELLGLSQTEWERCVLGSEAYTRRALGEILEPIEMIRDIVRRAGRTVSPETEQEMLRLRIARFGRAVVEVRPEILAALRTLKQRGHPLCLVSNADAIDIMRWGESPLAALFDEAIFSCRVHLIKPDPEIYLLAAKLAGSSPQACVFIGDGGSEELMGARRVGMRTIQVRHFVQREVEGADLIVDRLEEILDLV